jgi:hypothetical protein
MSLPNARRNRSDQHAASALLTHGLPRIFRFRPKTWDLEQHTFLCPQMASFISLAWFAIGFKVPNRYPR